MLGQRKLLIDNRYAQILPLFRTVDRDLLAVNKNLARVLLYGARQNLHQRGFSRAVFPQQRVDFSAVCRKAYFI
ncbi:hypothetical protein SDC9_184046 [bioreactor metagenome]|uniref:Uncharacterized protein n=1 Tax=bioreactor metagenome TaxID=1076179 RepID=A0A645HBX5_9ZZZZ